MVCASNAEVVVTYAYDHKGRMIRKDIMRTGSATVHIKYTWDGWNIIREELRTPHAQLRTTHNLWGLDLDGTPQGAGGVGGLLAVVRDGETYLPTYDANGNISEYIDSSDGTIAAHYDYSPFGEQLVASGPLAASFTHRFSTKPYCSVTGFCEYQMRKYRPDIGRWMSRDPMGEEECANCYLSSRNALVLFLDINGLFVYPIILTPPDTLPPVPEGPSPFDHFGNGTGPFHEEWWFEQNYPGWLTFSKKTFTEEINAGVDCVGESFAGPSSRLSVYPSGKRGGMPFWRTPGGNEADHGDKGQSDFSADKILGSFTIDYVTPVQIQYKDCINGKRKFKWKTTMYVEDILGSQPDDPIRNIPIIGPWVGDIAPQRKVRRAQWDLTGEGECDCCTGNVKGGTVK